MLDYFGWLFNWSSFIFLILLATVYISPLGKLKIGGEKAKPILTKWRWFAIAICTTIATGILFWGCAEPLYHFHSPPMELGFDSTSKEAFNFSLSTMYMHWSITPYGIYCITGLLFAIVYYNYKQPFRISSLFYPLLGNKTNKKILQLVDTLCLYALTLGMSASLATGILALMGGLETNFNIAKSHVTMALIGLAIIFTFIASAASGLQRGIKTLSNISLISFIILAIVVFTFGPTIGIIKGFSSSIITYVNTFVSTSTGIGSPINKDWLDGWTIFYWANWFAWAPISCLFLGRLAVGYSVREFVQCNLLLPSLFAILWMSIFSGTTLLFDIAQHGSLFSLMKETGEESVMYAIFNQLPFGRLISISTILMIFISYVTAADSNISAMSSISSHGIDPKHPEAPIWIKIIWGVIIGIISWIMLTYAGIDGIKMLSVLGGFPALFIIILAACGLLKLLIHSNTIPK